MAGDRYSTAAEGTAPLMGGQTASNAPGNSSRRRPRACDGCWQRKIRCDDGEECCRNCQIYGIQCTTTRADGSVILRGPHSSSGQSLPNPRLISKKRRRSMDGADSNSQQRHEHTPPDAIRNAAASNVASRSSRDLRDSIFTPARTEKPASKTDEVLEGALTIENARVPQKCKYAGRNSVQMMAMSAEDMFQDDEIRINVMRFFCPLMSFSEDIAMPPCIRSPLIEKARADRYVDAFFTTIHTMLPFLVEHQFREAFNNFYDKGQSGDVATVACIYLVIALGSRSVAARDDGSIHFNAAWSLYDHVMASPYLPSVQAFILMTLELMNRNKEGQAILAIGNGIRIAQSLGLHRALSSHKHPQERNFVKRHYRLRRCVWWVCYCLDKKLCFETGRPSIINDHDCDVDLIYTDEVQQAPCPFEMQAHEHFFFLSHLVEFCRILSDISILLFSKKFEPCDETAHLKQVEAIDTMLLKWKAALPDELQLDAELSGAHVDSSTECVILHCMYYNSLLTIHKAALFDKHSPEVRNNPNHRMAYADVVCWNAARALARAINDLANSGKNWAVMGWTTTYILTVVFTLYTGIMRNPYSWTCDSDTALMESMSRCFTRSNPNPVAISSFEELLHSLCGAIGISKKQIHDQPGSQPQQGNNSDSVFQSYNGSNIDPSMDFHFENLFGSRGSAEPGNVMQLWPVDFDGMGQSDFLPFDGPHGRQ